MADLNRIKAALAERGIKSKWLAKTLEKDPRDGVEVVQQPLPARPIHLGKDCRGAQRGYPRSHLPHQARKREMRYTIDDIVRMPEGQTFDYKSVGIDPKALQSAIEKHHVHSDDSNRAQSMVEQKKRHKFIDKVHVRYVEREKRYWAELENFGSKRIGINPRFYQEKEKLLESGIWAEITLAYNEVEEDDYAFYAEDLRPIQIAHFDIERFKKGREQFTTDEWIDVLMRSIGIDPTWLEKHSRKLKGDKNGKRLKYHILSRFLPMIRNNYNSIKLGGRSTG